MEMSGCASHTTQTDNTQHELLVRQGITVVRSDKFEFDWNSDIDPIEADLEHCATQAIDKAFPDLVYISREKFSQRAFPNLPADAVPLKLRDMRVLLDSRKFRERIEPLNLRYIVYVSGHTHKVSSHDWATIGGYMAATFIGMSTWERKTDASALVFDLKNPESTVDVESSAEGTGWVAGLFPIIVGAPATTEYQACRIVAEQLVLMLAQARKLEVAQ